MKLPKAYEPEQYESDIYVLWEKSRAFAPAQTGKSYTIVVPPPNANGNLHIGHALTLALEDVAIRYHRMKGDKTLFVPGADHAGFETQVVYEKQLAKEGKSRFDLSREELYRQIWDFVAQNRENYESQFRQLGASVDWEHYTFTLDEKVVRRAYATFKKMWDEGLIYRGERLVNFCTFHGTAFADIEVEHREEQGNLWFIRYPLTSGKAEIIVATTRPETMLGDTAVAVNPKDKRYKDFVGKTVKLPLTNREIPIIADDFVDEEFGTGAVKITPAHDQNDFDAGKRHDLPMITVIDHEGKMTDVPEEYRGLKVDEARKATVKDLETQGFLVKTEEHTHSVGHCYKCGTVIQPLLRDQWFVDMQPLAKPAVEKLKAKEVTFYPDSKRQQLVAYLDNLQDWNISRQIAWGIPIPAFQNVNDSDDWIYDERVTQEIIEVEGKTYRRDPDVFDTWFSSSSWPYSTLDFPDGDDFKEFYPLSLMETGLDLLAPWVSRMLMMGLYITGEVPFKAVYMHGLVLDEHGQKMSKSKGNVINPIEVANKFGSDALRIGVVSGRSPGDNQPFSEPKVISARNFCNKLWNVARYVENKVGDSHKNAEADAHTPADHWVLSKLQHSTEAIARDLNNYRFAEAYETLYHFVWDDFADWYIEASKTAPNPKLLAFCLESILKITHPFAPFVTETIWQTLSWKPDSILAVSAWPKIPAGDTKSGREFDEIMTVVSEARNLIHALAARNVSLFYEDSKLLDQNAALIAQLAGLKDVSKASFTSGVRLTQTASNCWLDIDVSTTEKYLERLKQKREEQTAAIQRLESRLENENYVRQAPAKVVEQTKAELRGAKALLDNLVEEAKRFEKSS